MIILAALLAMQGFSDGAAAAPRAKASVAHAAAKTAPVKTAPAKAGPDIAPLEKKLATWKGRWGYNDGKFVCETTHSSGDTAVDSVGCRALVLCLGPEGQRLNAIAQSPRSDKDRADAIQAIVAKSAPCVADKRREGLIAMAQLRGIKAESKGIVK